MKKRNNILFLLFVAVGMTGCNYMDELPYERSDAEDIFSSEALYERPTTQAYSYLKGGMSRVDDAFLEAATDNGTSVVYDSKIHTLAQGFATSNTPVEECWKNSYKGIHQALYAIENYRKYTLRLQNKTPEEIEQTKKTLRRLSDHRQGIRVGKRRNAQYTPQFICRLRESYYRPVRCCSRRSECRTAWSCRRIWQHDQRSSTCNQSQNISVCCQSAIQPNHQYQSITWICRQHRCYDEVANGC